MAESTSPSLALLGQELRIIREGTRQSLLQVSQAVNISQSVLSRSESGAVSIPPDRVAELLAHYRVEDPKRADLMELAYVLADSSWLELRRLGLPDTMYELERIEATYKRHVDWSPLIVPGRLQTPEYTRAVLVGYGTPDTEISARLAARMERQRRLLSAPDKDYTAYLASSSFDLIGDWGIVRGQLERLIQAVQREEATIRVLPPDAGAHRGKLGPFLLMVSPRLRPIVHLEHAGAVTYLIGDDAGPYIQLEGWLKAWTMEPGPSLQYLTEELRKVENRL